MQVGSGAHTYEWIENWAKVPADNPLGPVHGLAVDSKDRVYVHNRSKAAVAVFDREGNHLTGWGASFERGAEGIKVVREGGEEYLYLADPARHLVCKTRLDGAMQWWMGRPRRPDIYRAEADFGPTDVAVAPRGDFFVADGRGKSWIHQYDRDCKYVRSFGGPFAAEPGRTTEPHGLWVDTRGGKNPELYVADRGNNRLAVFAMDGKHRRNVTEGLNQPTAIAVAGDALIVADASGRVIVLDAGDQVVAVLGANGEASHEAEPSEQQGTPAPGRFAAPVAVAADSHGDLYVAESGDAGRIVKLRRQ